VFNILQHADECEQLAELARLPSNRHSLLSAAGMWRKMAADTKPRDGAGLDPVLGAPRSDELLLAQIEELDSAISRDLKALSLAKSKGASAAPGAHLPEEGCSP
jgi:hypothetical protein